MAKRKTRIPRDETLMRLKTGDVKFFGGDLDKLAASLNCSPKTVVQWRYGWCPEHVAELLAQDFPTKYA